MDLGRRLDLTTAFGIATVQRSYASLKRSRARSSSFDDFVGRGEEGRRDREIERLRGLEVDRQLELGRRLHRQVGGLRAGEDARHVGCRLAELVVLIETVAAQGTRRREVARGVDGR